MCPCIKAQYPYLAQCSECVIMWIMWVWERLIDMIQQMLIIITSVCPIYSSGPSKVFPHWSQNAELWRVQIPKQQGRHQVLGRPRQTSVLIPHSRSRWCAHCTRSQEHYHPIHIFHVSLRRCVGSGQDWSRPQLHSRREKCCLQVAGQTSLCPPSYRRWDHKCQRSGCDESAWSPARPWAGAVPKVAGDNRCVHALGLRPNLKCWWLWRLLLSVPWLSLRRLRKSTERPRPSQYGGSEAWVSGRLVGGWLRLQHL